MMLEDFKKDVKNSLREQVEAYREESQKCLKESQKSLKEFQENINKQVEAHREETQKSLKEFQENTIKQLKELNGNRSNQERTHGNNPGYRKPKEETRSCREREEGERELLGKLKGHCRLWIFVENNVRQSCFMLYVLIFCVKCSLTISSAKCFPKSSLPTSLVCNQKLDFSFLSTVN